MYTHLLNYREQVDSACSCDPAATEVVFRSEKIPFPGSYESNMMWIFSELKIPSPMFFS